MDTAMREQTYTSVALPSALLFPRGLTPTISQSMAIVSVTLTIILPVRKEHKYHQTNIQTSYFFKNNEVRT